MLDFRGEPSGYPAYFEGEVSIGPLLADPTANERAQRERAAEFLRTPGVVSRLLGTTEQWAAACRQAGLPEDFPVDPGPGI